MYVTDYLKLTEEEKQAIVAAITKQKQVRHARDEIAGERQKLKTREINNQLRCDHPMATSQYVANENEFGNLTGGGTYYHTCPDCGMTWSTNK
jgi:hypothetical protein